MHPAKGRGCSIMDKNGTHYLSACCRLVLLWAAIFLTCWSSSTADLASPPKDSLEQLILMKGVKPKSPDAYLCTAYEVSEDEAYIYKFEALANASTAHHMLMYGCDGEAFSDSDFWPCPSMCKSSPQTIMFAWAKNAPPFVMPKGVGLRVGKKTTIKTIVLQVHYAKSFKADEPEDHSGIKIYKTEQKPKYLAGILLMASGGFTVPPHNPSYPVDISCPFLQGTSIFPFAYRTHAHGLGKVITGYMYNDTYHLIGKGNPQWPQAFYPVKDVIEVKPGDFLAARCTYDSSERDRITSVGATGNDEMCNFYIMYYTDSSNRESSLSCYGNRLPQMTGNNFPADVSVPLPPNPALEEEAKGHHHHHHGGGGMTKAEESAQPATAKPTQPPRDIHFEHSLLFNSSWPNQVVDIGQVGGVAVDKQGNVYIFHRGSRVWDYRSFDLSDNFLYKDAPIVEDVVVIMDKYGNLIRKFGAGQYFMPHGITVDQENNIWLTDVALHQVFKIPANASTPSLTLGHRFQHSDDLSYFCKPTDVAVLSTGEFYVSDGYCNSRILKFSKDGQVIKSWGKRNLLAAQPPPTAFSVPHSLALAEDQKLICVADREHGRIPCFDLDGAFKHMILHPAFGPRLFAVEYCPLHGGILYAVNGPSFHGAVDLSVEGFTLDILTGALLETWNIPQSLKNPHDVTVDPDSHSVYVGELDPNAVWKLTRVNMMPTAADHHHDHDNAVDDKEAVMNVKKNKIDEVSAHEVSTAGKSHNDSNLASEAVAKREDDISDVTPSIVIGVLLVIPVVLLLVITLLVRAHQAGKLKCYGGRSKRVFNLQGLLGNSHKGFDPLSTEESDRDDPDDSDREEYTAPRKGKA